MMHISNIYHIKNNFDSWILINILYRYLEIFRWIYYEIFRWRCVEKFIKMNVLCTRKNLMNLLIVILIAWKNSFLFISFSYHSF